MTTTEKLTLFAALVESQQSERLKVDGLGCQCNQDNAKTTVRPAAKYAKVDIGSSGRFMVVNETGEIFGIKGYGVIHRGHPYGTLDTTSEWYWGDYQPRKLEGALA